MQFINYPGPSFKARLHQIQQTHPDVHYFLPAVHNGPVYDHNLNQVGQVNKLGNREMDVDSNSSMVCTKCRYICECGFARVAEQKISGTRVPLNFHFKESAGYPLVFSSAATLYFNSRGFEMSKSAAQLLCGPILVKCIIFHLIRFISHCTFYFFRPAPQSAHF